MHSFTGLPSSLRSTYLRLIQLVISDGLKFQPKKKKGKERKTPKPFKILKLETPHIPTRVNWTFFSFLKVSFVIEIFPCPPSGVIDMN